MLELDLFFSESGVCRVVFEFGLEFVAKDEMTLALVQVCRDEVVVSEGQKSVVEFRAGCFAKDWWAD